MDSTALLSLLHLSDLSLPVGGYAHSYGMETYVQLGILHNKQRAQAFIESMLGTNLRYTDAALVSLAYQAATRQDLPQLLELHAVCQAVKIPSETRAASERMGSRLAKIFQHQLAPVFSAQIAHVFTAAAAPMQYPVAFGICASALSVTLQDTLTGYFYNAAAGMVTNAVKLVPLGQQQGQEILFSLQPMIAELVSLSINPAPELIGVGGAGFDIRCMQHEALYSRLFMS